MILAVLYDSGIYPDWNERLNKWTIGGKILGIISFRRYIEIWSIPALFFDFNLEIVVKINCSVTRGKVKVLFEGGPK